MQEVKKWVAAVIVIASVVGVAVAQEAEKPAKWDTTIALGVGLTDGNSKTLGVNGSVATARDWEKHAVRMGVAANYGETEIETMAPDGSVSTDTEKTAQNAKALVNYKRKLDRMYLYTDDSILHDDLADLDYRLILGAGVGGMVIDGAKSKLGLELGAAYIRDELAVGESDDKAALRVAARHDHQFSETAKIWEAVEYLPDTADFADYLVNAEAGAEAALNTSLSLRVVLQDRYDSTPPGSSEYNDLSLIGSLVYKL